MADKKSAFNDLTHRRFEDGQEEQKGSVQLAGVTIVRLAAHLLESNGKLQEFEVELWDEVTCMRVARELESRGCKVERDPFRPLLIVKAPELSSLPKSA